MRPEKGMWKQIEGYRRMTPMERLAIGFQLNDLARDQERTSVRHQHPNWDEQRVEREVARRFGRLAGIPEALLPPPEEDEPIIVIQHGTTSNKTGKNQ